MGYEREQTSTFFTRLAYGLGLKRPATDRPPAPQTSLSTSLHQFIGSNVHLFRPIFAVFGLPDELILSILSHIAPDTQHTGHWVRFRIQHELQIDDRHRQRVQFLRPLSATCKAMRLRFLPWVWERLELPRPYDRNSGDIFVRKLNAIANTLHAGIYPATIVKYRSALLPPGLGLICVL